MIGNVGKTASMSMLALFESRYTLKGRYNIGHVGKTASMSMLALFESKYTLKGRYNIGHVLTFLKNDRTSEKIFLGKINTTDVLH